MLINKGIIKNEGVRGFYIDNSAVGINTGTIINTGDYGLYATRSGSTGTNEITGLIANDGKYGMYAVDAGKIINNGQIENTSVKYSCC